jgi:hypothetical protein
VCLSQRGENAIALVGTAEDRTRSRPKGTIDGREERADTYLAFYEDGAGSPLRETTAIVERMGAFKPGIVGPWLLWPLLFLTALGVPCGIVWAALRAVQT